MLDIVICDDNLECLSKIEKYIDDYISVEGLPMSMACVSTSPDYVLNFLKQRKEVMSPFGAYFLDIHLENSIDGINLAETIRNYDPRGFIIFITMDPDFLPVALMRKLEVLDYIVKGNLNVQERICSCIDSIYKRLTSTDMSQKGKLVLKLIDDMKGTIVSVNLSDILYIQSSMGESRGVSLYTHSQRHTFRRSLTEIMFDLDERFFRCHKSVIVNLERITSIDRATMTVRIADEHEVPVANRTFSKLKQLLELL